MKELVIAQLQYFLVSLAWGIMLMCVYDGIRVFRHYKKHSPFWEGVEDVLFWCIASVFVYRMSFYGNYGIIRAYSLFALAAGMIFYRKCCSRAVLRLMCLVFDRLRKVFAVPLRGFRKIWHFIKGKFITPLKSRVKSCIMNNTLWKKWEKGDGNDEETFSDEKKSRLREKAE